MAVLRVVYAGYNFFSSCLVHLLARSDIEVVLCMTGKPTETVENIVNICYRAAIPLRYGRPAVSSLKNIVRDLCPDLLICAAYSYRIPTENLGDLRCINIHPSLLPIGRGPNPLPRLLTNGFEHCGLSIHEMSASFDTGPVLDQEIIDINQRTHIGELALTMFALAPKLLGRVLDNFEDVWSRRTPQVNGSYWEATTDEDRTIYTEVHSIGMAAEIVRRFATLGVRVVIKSKRVLESFSITTLAISHSFVPGTVVMESSSVRYIALSDGLILVRVE